MQGRVDVARPGSPSALRSPLPPVTRVEAGCAVGALEAVGAAAASGVLREGAGSSIPVLATESASATDPLSAPVVDEGAGRSEESGAMVEFGSLGSFFAVVLAPARRPEAEPASGSGIEASVGSGPGIEVGV